MKSKVATMILLMVSNYMQSIISESTSTTPTRTNIRGKRKRASPAATQHTSSSIDTEQTNDSSTSRQTTSSTGTTNIFQSTSPDRIRIKCQPKRGEQDRFNVQRCNESCNRNFTRNCDRTCNCYATSGICRDSKEPFRFVTNNGDEMVKKCNWVRRKNTQARCNMDITIARNCLATCNPMRCN